MKLPVNRFAVLTFTTILAACGGKGGDVGTLSSATQAERSGPAADYPIVLGQPFVVDGVTYTPQDKLNYDQVGYAGVAPGDGITVSHRTLPLPSYAEVTSLDSGRTILVRVTRRGPMTGDRMIDLSPAAAAQLGVQSDRAPIRIRRVNPAEPERAALREGREAPLRMDTPKSLVAVLRRKLEPGATAPLSPLPKVVEAGGAPAPAPGTAAQAPAPAIAKAQARPASKPAPKMMVSKSAQKAAPAGSFVVQIGAFSDEGKSAGIASKLEGQVSASGKLFRVRMGPFATRGQAEAALSKARAAGYSDARIQSAN
ncbi:MAG: SPOR domain-containing protein [Novosphingobium sp.]